jgi:hypothetical protein
MSWKDYRPKSPEELAKEKEEQARREEELQKKQKELIDGLDQAIKKCDEFNGMEFALEHLSEPEKIAEHTNNNSKTYSDTSMELRALSRVLRSCLKIHNGLSRRSIKRVMAI